MDEEQPAVMIVFFQYRWLKDDIHPINIIIIDNSCAAKLHIITFRKLQLSVNMALALEEEIWARKKVEIDLSIFFNMTSKSFHL